MEIKQYSLKADGKKKLSPNFTVYEFRCRDGSDVVMIDESLVVLLQCIREHFGKPITITSGYRTAAHNAAVGGAKSSQHLLGRAADIQVAGVSVEDVAAYASLLPGWGGLGRYRSRQAAPGTGACRHPAQQEQMDAVRGETMDVILSPLSRGQ